MYILFIVSAVLINSFAEPINGSCNSDDECIQIKGVCINNNCACDALSYYSSTEGKCLKYATGYTALCVEDQQCEEFLESNGKCIHNQCLCVDGYRWYQGKCTKYLKKGDTCTETDICLDVNDYLALACMNNICQCDKGYYDRGEDCRVKSSNGGECAINEDCFPYDFLGIIITSHCELGKCVMDPGMNFKDRFSMIGNGFVTSVQDTSNSDLHGSDSTTDISSTDTTNNLSSTTTTSNLSSTTITTALPTTTEPIPTCQQGVLSTLTEEECAECANTKYFLDAACICAPGFLLHDGKCVAELGMLDTSAAYNEDKDCPIKPGRVKEGICYCRDYWFQHYTNKECKKTTLQYTSSCMDNDWCKAMGPYAYCNSQTKKCECISQAQLNETSFYCELTGTYDPTGICLEDTDCSLYEQCIDLECQCTDGYFKNDEHSDCLPKIGSSCELRNCAHIDNATCSADEICTCISDNFVTDGFKCLEEATHLNETCLIDDQCQKITNSECLPANNETSLCLCKDEYKDFDSVCYFKREYGWQCSTSFDCTVNLGDTFICRNNLCLCPVYYTYKNDKCQPNSAPDIKLWHFYTLFITVISLSSCF